MNTNPAANQSPIFSLLRRGLLQSWRPYQRDRYFTTVCQHNAQTIIRAANVNGKRLNFNA